MELTKHIVSSVTNSGLDKDLGLLYKHLVLCRQRIVRIRFRTSFLWDRYSAVVWTTDAVNVCPCCATAFTDNGDIVEGK